MARNRAGQYALSLRRDLLADYYDETMDSTCFIQKGWVDSSNPLIFNPEGVTVNKIQEHEILLRDSTRAAWIVGYVAPNLADDADPDTILDTKTITIEYPQEAIPDISTFEYSEYIGKTVKGYINQDSSYYSIYGSDSINYRSYTVAIRYLNNTGRALGTQIIPTSEELTVTNLTCAQIANLNLTIPTSTFYPALDFYLTDTNISELLLLNNKIYRDGANYKKVVIEPATDEDSDSFSFGITASTYPSIYQAITSKLTEANANYNDGRIMCNLKYQKFTVKLEDTAVPFTKASITFNKTNRPLYDAPYKMFCIPVSQNARLKFGDIDIPMDRDRQLQIASSIATGLGKNIYDIQLLPYCPIADQFIHRTDVNGNEYLGGTADMDYTLMKDEAQNAIGILFWCPRSSFTTNIKTAYLAYPQLNYNNPLEFKVGNESTYMRLVAPNYANYQDINYYMNYGIDYINIDCTYKPITPYVKLNINYKGLYGQDFDNNRGLVLGGDYSLPIMSDA